MGTKQKIDSYVRAGEKRGYDSGIPDNAPIELDHLVPCYRKIAFALLKNDLKIIGIHGKASVYYGILKRIELGIFDRQLKLNL